MNILNLPHWDIIKTEENDDNYRVTARYTAWPDTCPRCGVKNANISRFGTKKQTFLDLPVHARRVGIRLERQRFMCKECGDTFLQRIPDLDDDHLMTKRLLEYIQNESLKRTFVSVAEDTGVVEGTVRNIFKEYIKELDKTYVVYAPEWLGIDEIHLLKKYRCVLANVKENTIIDILTSRRQDVVARYIARIPDRSKIAVVTMDMWGPYRDIITNLIPHAQIVIDKYHVVRMANDGLEIIRKKTREDLTQAQRRQLKDDRFILLKRKANLKEKDIIILESWIKNFPLLGKAYELKEQFFDIWDTAPNSKEAGKEYKKWKQSIPLQLEPAFDALTTAIGNWENHVFAYFDTDPRITNAYTEALNGVIKMINRLGRGYSFEAIRAKILYNGGLRKHPKAPYRSEKNVFHRVEPQPVIREPAAEYETGPGDLSFLTKFQFDYGVSIPLLLELLRETEETPNSTQNYE
jgi:transposase